MAKTWRKYGVTPRRESTFKLSTDPQLVAKVVDIVGLYVAPPEKAIVLCVDEKSQIQAFERSAPGLPMQPGRPAPRTHEYIRHGQELPLVMDYYAVHKTPVVKVWQDENPGAGCTSRPPPRQG